MKHSENNTSLPVRNNSQNRDKQTRSTYDIDVSSLLSSSPDLRETYKRIIAKVVAPELHTHALEDFSRDASKPRYK